MVGVSVGDWWYPSPKYALLLSDTGIVVGVQLSELLKPPQVVRVGVVGSQGKVSHLRLDLGQVRWSSRSTLSIGTDDIDKYFLNVYVESHVDWL